MEKGGNGGRQVEQTVAEYEKSPGEKERKRTEQPFQGPLLRTADGSHPRLKNEKYRD